MINAPVIPVGAFSGKKNIRTRVCSSSTGSMIYHSFTNIMQRNFLQNGVLQKRIEDV